MKKFAIIAVAAIALTWSDQSAGAKLNVYSSSDPGIGIKSIDINPVDNSSGGEDLVGKITQDIVVTFTGELRSSQLYLELSEGEVFISEFGGGPAAPIASFFPAFPQIQFNTFYGIGGRSNTEQSAIGGVIFPGGAIDIGGSASLSYDEKLLDQSWAPAAAVVVADKTEFFLARISLSSDAKGFWRFTTRSEINDVGERVYLNNDSVFLIENGQMVPEPSAILLGCCGVAGVVAVAVRRRRKALAA